MNRRKKPRYKLIINMPDLVARHAKISGNVFTVVFWGFFVYLWMPLITILAWSLGLYRSYSEFVYTQELSNLKHLAFFYTIIVLALGGTLLMWALQEYLRFRNVNRRLEPMAVEIHELEKYADISVDKITAAQSARRIVAHHGIDGGLIDLT